MKSPTEKTRELQNKIDKIREKLGRFATMKQIKEELKKQGK